MTRVAAFLVALPVAFAQTNLDPSEILKRVEEAYKAASQYELASSVKLHDPNDNIDRQFSMHLWFKPPDKYRQENSGIDISMSPGGRPIDEGITVFDGSKLWVYAPKLNQYRVYTAPDLPRDTSPPATDLYMGAGPFRRASELISMPRLLREESLKVGGNSVDCYVIGESSGTMLWIDKQTFHVLKMGDGINSSTYTTVNLDGAFSDELFKFVPPQEARKID